MTNINPNNPSSFPNDTNGIQKPEDSQVNHFSEPEVGEWLPEGQEIGRRRGVTVDSTANGKGSAISTPQRSAEETTGTVMQNTPKSASSSLGSSLKDKNITPIEEPQIESETMTAEEWDKQMQAEEDAAKAAKDIKNELKGLESKGNLKKLKSIQNARKTSHAALESIPKPIPVAKRSVEVIKAGTITVKIQDGKTVKPEKKKYTPSLLESIKEQKPTTPLETEVMDTAELIQSEIEMHEKQASDLEKAAKKLTGEAAQELKDLAEEHLEVAKSLRNNVPEFSEEEDSQPKIDDKLTGDTRWKYI
ncbi:MAG: hypothetical protein JWO53_651 [Chlamydiia bacterium]|nr:hypothetical protein [Chlamydiia bacterium]